MSADQLKQVIAETLSPYAEVRRTGASLFFFFNRFRVGEVASLCLAFLLLFFSSHPALLPFNLLQCVRSAVGCV
jgi:hypothetical protein